MVGAVYDRGYRGYEGDAGRASASRAAALFRDLGAPGARASGGRGGRRSRRSSCSPSPPSRRSCSWASATSPATRRRPTSSGSPTASTSASRPPARVRRPHGPRHHVPRPAPAGAARSCSPRPLTGADYVLAKVGAMFAIVFAFSFLPAGGAVRRPDAGERGRRAALRPRQRRGALAGADRGGACWRIYYAVDRRGDLVPHLPADHRRRDDHRRCSSSPAIVSEILVEADARPCVEQRSVADRPAVDGHHRGRRGDRGAERRRGRVRATTSSIDREPIGRGSGQPADPPPRRPRPRVPRRGRERATRCRGSTTAGSTRCSCTPAW